MMLSIGIMMKNEEKYIEKCLIALMPILESIESEIVIIDTGSTDRSIEIAQKYTENIYSYEWKNDFSYMRNKIISHCKGKWYLSVDADEILENPDSIINFFKSNECEKYNNAIVNIKNYIESKNYSYTINELNRLFRLDKDFKYISSIHEQPCFKEPTKVLSAIFEHYGYLSDDKELMERKFERNKNLLEKELKKNINNIYIKYQLAVTYSMHGEYKKALGILEKIYKKMSVSERKAWKQVSIEYSNALIRNDKVSECIKVCEDGLKLYKEDEQYKIDLAFNIASMQLIEKKYNESIRNFKLYFRLIEKWERGELPADSTVTTYRVPWKISAYIQMIQANYEICKYQEVIKYSMEMKGEHELLKCMNYVIKSFIKLECFKELNEFYKDKIVNATEKAQLEFIHILEKEKLELHSKKNNIINEYFKENDDLYGQYVKAVYEDMSEEFLLKLVKQIAEIDVIYYMGSFGQILYKSLKNRYDLVKMFNILSSKTILEFIGFCYEKYANEINELILRYIDNDKSFEFENVRLKMIFLKGILILDEKKKEEYSCIFKKYVEYGIEYIRKVYSKYIIENKLINYINDDENKFLLYMLFAQELKNKNTKEYLIYLKKALKVYPLMKDGIKKLVDETNDKFDDNFNEMNILKMQLITNIKILISNNKINDAKMVINQYEEFMGSDSEIIDLKLKIE